MVLSEKQRIDIVVKCRQNAESKCVLYLNFRKLTFTRLLLVKIFHKFEEHDTVKVTILTLVMWSSYAAYSESKCMGYYRKQQNSRTILFEQDFTAEHYSDFKPTIIVMFPDISTEAFQLQQDGAPPHFDIKLQNILMI